MLGVADHIIILIVLHIIGGVPVAEAVHHDLILHGTLCPGRGVETGREGKGNAGVRLFTLGQNMGTGLLKGDAETAGLHNKGIGHLVGKAHQFRHIVVVIRIGRILAHEDSHFRLTDIEQHPLCRIFFYPQADSDRIARIRLGRRTEQVRLVAED